MSGKKALLDTNVVIDLLSGDAEVTETLSELDELFFSVIAVGELYYGAENSSKKEYHLEQIERFLGHCRILPFDEKISLEYARFKMTLRKKGRPIPENDIWIAATAKALDLMIISRDSHFRELNVELRSP